VNNVSFPLENSISRSKENRSLRREEENEEEGDNTLHLLNNPKEEAKRKRNDCKLYDVEYNEAVV
jgi:hypothetical protein